MPRPAPVTTARRDPHSFLVLRENQFAYASALRLAAKTSAPARPVVTAHGPSGVGKSHLARQLIRAATAEQPDLLLAHVTAAEFAAEWETALTAKCPADFERAYGGLELLICEDVQHLVRREMAQGVLVRVVDEVLASGGRVLLTAARAPGELRPLSPRLVSRCHAGVCAAIDLPGETSRLKLLSHYAQAGPASLPMDVLRFLAEAFPASPRELLAMLTRLRQTAEQRRVPIDAALARRVVSQEPASVAVPISRIARAVAREFGVSVHDLRSPTRAQALVVPRHVSMWLARELTHAGYSKIGDYFSGRRHSSVVHACHRTQQLLDDHPRLASQLRTIRATLAASRGGAERRKPDNRRRTRPAHAG